MLAQIKPDNGPVQSPQPSWYALYTCARHEKRVVQQIERRRLSCFLPLYRSVRRWKDRRKELDPVLFPGFVFVQIKLQDRSRVLQLPGVVRVVSFDGRPAALPVGEIEKLRERLFHSSNIEPLPDPGGAFVRATAPCKDQRKSSCVGKNRAGWFSPSMSFSDQSQSRWMRPI